MHIVTVSTILEAPAGDVWAVAGDFGGIRRWSSAIQDCQVEGTGVGSLRTLTTAGGQVREQLVEWDPAARRLGYGVISGSSLPVRGMRAWITVTPTGERACRVDWRIEGEPTAPVESVSQQLRSRYAARLQELRDCVAKEQP